jgi:2Fe-2S ferredoxin
MPEITFILDDGTEQTVEANSGSTVMQAAIDNGIEAMVAECGGACACATCHCYIEQPWQDKVNPASQMETDMLDCAVEPNEYSRLGCQVTLTDELNGIAVKLPASQY